MSGRSAGPLGGTKVVFFASTGQRKCMDVWSEGFSSAGNEGLLDNFTKIICANSISKNGLVW